jgi:hypothetical protein
MTIVLQYQFWDLKVTPDVFEVGLSFGGVPERLIIPLAAITSFVDPSVQFALQFQAVPEAADELAGSTPIADKKAEKPAGKSRPATKTTVPAVSTAKPPADPAVAAANESASDKPGAEVVRLDRFRKK